MPNKPKDNEEEEPRELLPDDSPLLSEDGREAITHPEEVYQGPIDSTYRPGDPPPGQSLFPPDQFRERVPDDK